MTRRYTCAYCAAEFNTVTDHMSHVVAKHDAGFVASRSDRLKRASTCWSCAAEIPASDTHCACGALHPRLR